MKRIPFLLLFCLMTAALGAQTRSLPTSFYEWLKSEGMQHATVSLEVAELPSGNGAPRIVYSYDEQRMVSPASVMKLVTTGTALRLLGSDYVIPDYASVVDTSLQLPVGLEGYNPHWLLEDVGQDYMPPLTNEMPDSGHRLSEIVAETNHRSLNREAENLLRLLSPSYRLDSGIIVVRNYWTERGLDTRGLWMFDGCGLSPNDRLTARFVVSLLCDLHDEPTFVRSLPVVGQDGTVVRFLRKTRLEKKGRLKTGTLKNVVAYAGYMTGTNGKTYALAIFVNNPIGEKSIVRKGIERVMLSLIP